MNVNSSAKNGFFVVAVAIVVELQIRARWESRTLLLPSPNNKQASRTINTFDIIYSCMKTNYSPIWFLCTWLNPNDCFAGDGCLCTKCLKEVIGKYPLSPDNPPSALVYGINVLAIWALKTAKSVVWYLCGFSSISGTWGAGIIWLFIHPVEKIVHDRLLETNLLKYCPKTSFYLRFFISTIATAIM